MRRSTLLLGMGDDGQTSLPEEVSYEAESETLFAAMSVEPDATRKGHIDDLIAALKTASVWSTLDYLRVYAAADTQAASLNWKNPGTYNATLVNSPTFTADRGYAGNGTTSYIDSNFNPSTAGGQYAQDSAHIGVWVRDDIANNAHCIGSYLTTSTRRTQINPRTAGNTLAWAINRAAAPETPANSAGSGHFVTRRSASNASAVFRNATSVATSIGASDALANLNIYELCSNGNGTPVSHTARQLAAAHVGASLTDQKITDFYNALSAYLTAVGAT
jgi:hypothetical protein